MAAAMGWLLPRSAAAASASAASRGHPPHSSQFTTSQRPSVRVPVLSSRTAFTRPSASRAVPPRISTPALAAAAMAHTAATGVDSTRAHGHDTTSTCSARYTHRRWSLLVAQGTNAMSAAATSTSGVYHLAKRATAPSSGERWEAALSTSRPSSATVLLSAPAVVLTSRVSSPALMVPPSTSSPGPFATGAASPVIMAWLAAEWPDVTTPSVGTWAPGAMITATPTPISDAGTVSPFAASTAVEGLRARMAVMASRARPVARTSSHSAPPNSTTTAAASV
mmetsp:Transcript_12653/g.38134  ORF Transcript_12653/g.38134 Transcript_12653/m.38134 type:complete len:280 (+) Transcript_12653:2110-2949(+)